MASRWAPVAPTPYLRRTEVAAAPRPSATRPMAPAPTVQPTQHDDGRPCLRVLVAEDNPTLRILSMRLVRRLGHEVESVTTGAEAVTAVMAGRFDVVLMDMRMPVMDGLEAARHIRAAGDRIPQPRIVAVTASATLRDQERYRAAGMDDYVSKPFSGEDLQRAFLPAELVQRTAPAARPLARQRFTRLDELGAEAKRLVLETLVTRGVEDLGALDEALANEDAVRLRFLAHRLRGSGLAIGSTQLADAALRLETAAESDVVDEVLVTAVRSAYEQCVRDIHWELHASR